MIHANIMLPEILSVANLRQTLSTSLAYLPLLFIIATGCKPDPVELRATVYEKNAKQQHCEVGMRPGADGLTDEESTADSTKFSVRTPLNYDAIIAHPLLVVYAAAGRSRAGSERQTKLTAEATEAGFIIAYADNKRLSKNVLADFGTIPDLIAQKWCIDKQRIYFTGHSDGGTVSMGLAFTDETKHLPTAVAPSAAGIKASDLAEYDCPEPLSVMIMHSRDDSLFPGYGAETATWWATCNQCDATPGASGKNGCISYANCAGNVSTVYCEGSGSHGDWPRMNSAIIDFFKGMERAKKIAPDQNVITTAP